MDFMPNQKSREWVERVSAFMDEHVYPAAATYESQLRSDPADPWKVPPVMAELQARAKAAGLWTMHIQDPRHGAGLTNLEYAPIAEILGRVHWASEVFNSNAPDSGNMDVLSMYGSPAQQEKWLTPMLDGRIKSSFVMTEPGVASSDATNISTRIERDGDHYVINGHKWWITNAMDPRTKLFIVVGKTDPAAPRHQQHTQILVEPDTPGITIVRPLAFFGYLYEPYGHAEIKFDNVRVPAENILLGEGRGFEIAQGRLGGGRIHHCMRIIGMSEVLIEKLCRRLVSRTAFGKALADQTVWQARLAEARANIEMSRLLVYKAAWKIDTVGARSAMSEISQIKLMVPRLAQQLCDMTQQAFGAAGMNDDFGLAYTFARLRVIRVGDGPDDVHAITVARNELKPYRAEAESAAQRPL